MSCLNNILLENTPLYSDIISVINDYSVGNKKYWKGKFQECIGEINKFGCRVFTLRYDKPFQNVWRYEWKRTQKELKLNTKKKIVEYYIQHYIIEAWEEKSMMRMKKERLLNVFVAEMKDKFLVLNRDNYEEKKNTMYYQYLEYYSRYW